MRTTEEFDETPRAGSAGAAPAAQTLAPLSCAHRDEHRGAAPHRRERECRLLDWQSANVR
jgi:hypothetical protein